MELYQWDILFYMEKRLKKTVRYCKFVCNTQTYVNEIKRSGIPDSSVIPPVHIHTATFTYSNEHLLRGNQFDDIDIQPMACLHLA